MTWLVGWKRGGVAFLCADSMVTDGPPDPQEEGLSSFGEAHIEDGKRRVREGALKIVHLGKMALGMAGIFENGARIVRDVEKHLQAGLDPREAFIRAVELSPERARGVHLIAVIAEEPSAGLLFNRGSGPVEEVHEGQIAFGGNANEKTKIYVELVRSALMLLAQSSCSAEELLVCVLGYLQGLGAQHSELVQRFGIGGVFVGIYAQEGRLRWQPDLMYAVSAREKWRRGEPPDYIASVVRHNVLIVNSTFVTLTRLFSSDINASPEQFREVRERWVPEANFGLISEGPFDYISLVDMQTWSLGVVQMKRHMESNHLRLRVRKIADYARGIALDMTNELRDGLVREPLPRQPEPGSVLGAHGVFVFKEYAPPDHPWPEPPPEALLKLSDIPPRAEKKKPTR